MKTRNGGKIKLFYSTFKFLVPCLNTHKCSEMSFISNSAAMYMQQERFLACGINRRNFIDVFISALPSLRVQDLF